MESSIQPAAPERYFKATTLAAMFDVHPSTIWRWADRGVIAKPVKLSAGVSRWRASDVESMIESGKGAA